MDHAFPGSHCFGGDAFLRRLRNRIGRRVYGVLLSPALRSRNTPARLRAATNGWGRSIRAVTRGTRARDGVACVFFFRRFVTSFVCLDGRNVLFVSELCEEQKDEGRRMEM